MKIVEGGVRPFLLKDIKTGNCLVGSLFLTKRQNFRLVQIESNCRRQNKCD